MGTPENLLYEIPPDPHPARSSPSFPLRPHKEIRQFHIQPHNGIYNSSHLRATKHFVQLDCIHYLI